MMKTPLLIIGIVVLTAAVLSLLFAALNLHAYRHMLDGSAEHYARLHQRAVLFFVIGGVLAAAGAACFVIRHFL